VTRGVDQKILGVDIDGVLNHHRHHFCRLLKSQTGKELSPEEITVIPVHLIPGCDVTEADEHAVFNWPAYWTEMPAVQEASHSLAQLRSRNLLIRLFTWRPWPNPATFPAGREDSYLRAWQDVADIRGITAEWLERSVIPYDQLTIEMGLDGEETRLSASRHGKIHTFVEDSLKNAISLAPHCERIFLIDQPYNQSTQIALPPNVVRVRTWNDIAFAL
jgi:uncharacterized HAD superfamily protein